LWCNWPRLITNLLVPYKRLLSFYQSFRWRYQEPLDFRVILTLPFIITMVSNFSHTTIMHCHYFSNNLLPIHSLSHNLKLDHNFIHNLKIDHNLSHNLDHYFKHFNCNHQYLLELLVLLPNHHLQVPWPFKLLVKLCIPCLMRAMLPLNSSILLVNILSLCYHPHSLHMQGRPCSQPSFLIAFPSYIIWVMPYFTTISYYFFLFLTQILKIDHH